MNLFYMLLLILASLFYTTFYPLEYKTLALEPMGISISGDKDTIKAQIEIEIENTQGKRLAKLFDRIKKGDKLQAYVKPIKDCVVWVIVENESGVALVNSSVLLGNTINILPSKRSDYEVDGKSSYEKFIFVIALGKDSQLLNSSYDNIRLKNILSDIKKQSEIVISEEGDELIDISGNVRDPKLVSKKVFKGINYLTVEYHFDVRK